MSMTVGITELPPEGMQLGGVALAGDAERGTKTTEGLSLLFTTAGITVQGPQPQIERLLVWSGLDSATCREKVVLPDGRNAAVMELTSGGQSIRFLFPTESVTPGQAAYLDQALPHWLARYKGAPPAPATINGSGNVQGAPAAANGTAANGNGNGNGSTPPAPAPAPPTPTADQSSPLAPAAAAAGVAGMAAAGAVAGDSYAGAQGLASGAPGAPGTAPVGQAPPPPPPVAAPAPPAPPSAAPPPPPPIYGTPAASPSARVGSPPPPPGMGDGSGWMASPDPLGDTSAWAGPSPDIDLAPPAKKSGRWRKSKETAVAPMVAPVDPSRPPYEAPHDPVRLNDTTLPPPDLSGAPAAAGSVVWKPPVDPVTGAALWEGQPAAYGSDAPAPELATPTKGRAKRKADKAAKAAAVGTAAAMAGAGAATLAAPSAPPAPGFAPAPDANLTTTQFDTLAGSSPPGDPGAVYETGAPQEKPPARNNTLLILLFVALLAVVAGIAYFVVKKNNTTTTTPTSLPGLSTAAADAALAATINLHQNDLPSGWVPSTAAGQPTRPPVAPAAAQSQAARALGQCLGVPAATVSGLFAGTVVPGQSGSATSPAFQSPTDPTIRMASTTRVMTAPDQAAALATPFTDASFVACYTAYQSSVVSAAVPGATASVESVPLAAPAGVQTFAYLTTLTIPNQGTEVIGQAFIIGGRIESTLEPTTGGAPVPTDAFTSAYNAISGRVGLAVSK
jgi:hypothetical protein